VKLPKAVGMPIPAAGERLVRDNLIGLERRLGSVAEFRNTLAYDVLARLPLALWFALCGGTMLRHLGADLDAAPDVTVALVLQVLARVAALGFITAVILALALRLPPVARAAGMLPRVVAFGGTFSLTALAFFPRVELTPLVAATSLVLILVGNGLACYALAHLGRSLSMMPEARRLVMTGPYAIVRHPLYVAEALASLGLLLQFLSPLAVCLWIAHLALQCGRMRNEETVLGGAFSDYEGYARRVPRLLPGIY
jgi:protein-S-isoprenylcysteine O-methyltransferase Ste14